MSYSANEESGIGPQLHSYQHILSQKRPEEPENNGLDMRYTLQ